MNAYVARVIDYVKTKHAAQDERPDPDSVKLMLEEE